jgi:hypothetical protein
MAGISDLLAEIRTYVNGRRDLALFEQYSQAVHTARATGTDADRAKALTLGQQLEQRYPAPAVRRNTATVKSELHDA